MSDRPLVAVLDYGIGNLHSAHKAIEHMGADARLTADPGLIADADGVVLPGVGAFGACMAALRAARLEQPALDAVDPGVPSSVSASGCRCCSRAARSPLAPKGSACSPARSAGSRQT